jgi:hypothetical protein
MTRGKFHLPMMRGAVDPPIPPITEWTRNSEWLSLPTVLDTDQKIVGLFKVDPWDIANRVAIKISGDYTVDWGDGSASEDFDADDLATHNYDFDEVDSGTTTTEGYRQVIIEITMQSGQDMTEVHLNIAHPEHTQQYGTGWLDIRMAGSEIGVFNFVGWGTSVLHTNLEQFDFIGTNKVEDWEACFWNCLSLVKVVNLDLASGTNISYLFWLCSSLLYLPDPIKFPAISGDWSAEYIFGECYSLQKIHVEFTGVIENLLTFCFSCYSLYDIKLTNSHYVKTWDSCFSYTPITEPPEIEMHEDLEGMYYVYKQCHRLKELPVYDFSQSPNISDIAGLYDGLRQMKEIPENLSVKGIGRISNLFSNWWGLVEATLDIDGVEDASFLFNTCPALKKATLQNPESLKSMNGMFSTCHSLEDVIFVGSLDSLEGSMNSAFQSVMGIRHWPFPSGADLSKITTWVSSFQFTHNLESVPDLDLSGATSFQNMFRWAYRLKRVGKIWSPGVTNFTGMFQQASALISIEELQCWSGGTNNGNFLNYYNTSLIWANLKNVKGSFSVQRSQLGRAGMIQLMKGLNGGITNLDGAIDDSQTTIEVDDASLLVERGFAFIWDESITNPTSDANREIIFIDSISGNTLTVVRGELQTSERSHPTGRKVGTYNATTYTLTFTDTPAVNELEPADWDIALNRGWNTNPAKPA